VMSEQSLSELQHFRMDENENEIEDKRVDEKEKPTIRVRVQDDEKPVEVKLIEDEIKEEKSIDEKKGVDEKDNIQNYDLSEPKQPSLIQRLADYSIVNKAFTTYDYIKHSNSLLNAGLSTAENTAAVALAYTCPVVIPRVQPYLNAVDARFGVEETGNIILDKIEAKVQTATDVLVGANAYIVSSKNAAQDLVLGLPQKSYDALIDRPLDQLLERLEFLVDRFLPPTFDVEKLELSSEGVIPKSTRIATIGKEVPKRLINLAQQKYPQYHLTEDQALSFTFLVDLIQYAVDTIDLNSKKEKVVQVYNSASTLVSEGKHTIENKLSDGKHAIENKIADVSTSIKVNAEICNAQYVSPIRTAIEERLNEISQSDLRSYTGVVAAIAHASELAKRQLFMRLDDSQNLMAEFKTYLDSSKKAILSFDKKEIPIYLQNLRSNAAQALSSILSLISTYIPKELKLPSISNVATNLEQWRVTLEQRIFSIQSGEQETTTTSITTEKKKDTEEK
jgi:hypothetical protein